MFFYKSSLPELRWRPFHMARCSKEDRTPARSCHFKKKKNCAVYGTHKQYLHFICVSVAHENQNVQHDYQISFHFPKNKISYFFLLHLSKQHVIKSTSPLMFFLSNVFSLSRTHISTKAQTKKNMSRLPCKIFSFIATATTTAAVGCGGGSSRGTSTAPGTRFWALPVSSFPLLSSPSLPPPAGWWRGRPSCAGT
jgi:hypothetical protein